MRSPDSIPIRILVTGCRGKSSLVRLLCSALAAEGVSAYGRITGVLPREISSRGERLILRGGPASVEEMRWWLSTLPADCGAVVLENSAVAPDLQPLAFRWLRPQCTVLVNVRPDHADAWGEGEEEAARALCGGIEGGAVVLPFTEARKEWVGEVLSGKGCTLLPCQEGTDHRHTHLSLVRNVLRHFHLDEGRGIQEAESLGPDIADFSLFRENGGILASAFSANDVESTEELFLSTGWKRNETTVLFNSRKDRISRFRTFLPWLIANGWRRVYVAGAGPWILPKGLKRLRVEDGEAIRETVRRERQVFGCGNVAGAPLQYLLQKTWEREGGDRLPCPIAAVK